ncbi:MAG: hypothetical protein AAB903_02920, partial [Patescibacteria group bacterium]
LYMGVRVMARLEDEVIYMPERKSFWKRLSSSGFLERLDIFLVRLIHRFLRRTRIVLLRLDNILTVWLKKTRLKSGEEGIHTEFKEMTGMLARSPKEGHILSDIREADTL